jgi:hypothetical protein
MAAVAASALQCPPLFVAPRLFANHKFSYPRLGASFVAKGHQTLRFFSLMQLNTRFRYCLR